MANIVVRTPIVWLYLHICRPVNFVNFPLDMYIYGGQTIRPDDRQFEHFVEEKRNPKYAEMLKLVPIEYWEFIAWPIFRYDGETDSQYYNRVALLEQKLIRDLQLCYCTSEYDSPHGLNASIGGESPLNDGYRCNIPGKTTGVKNLTYETMRNTYRYAKSFWRNNKIITKELFRNKNPFLVYLYMESYGEEDFIIDENIFWNRVKKWWNDDIYNARFCRDYLGIKGVSIRKQNNTVRGFFVSWQHKEGKKILSKSRVSFSNFLQLYQDGILDVNDIYCLDFFIWNAKLILEGKFDIKNSRPNVFYDDFFEFRKIRHFTVDNLKEAIEFLKVLEGLSDLSIPVGQQRLQCT